MSPRRHLGWIEIVVTSAFLLAVLVRLPTLDQPLLEEQAFRQTQTAYTALLYHQDGIDLLHPKLPVLGPPFEVPFELPLFQAAASVPMSWGLSPDASTRTTGLLFFLVSAGLLFAVVRRAAGPIAAIAALMLFLFSPFAILWGRTSMIEYLATAGSLGFVLTSMLWLERPRVWVGALALICVAVALLVKVTTGFFWLLPALLYLSVREPSRLRDRVLRRVPLILFAAVGLVLTYLWTRHADSIKAANPATSWLTSRALTEWNFGTLDQRLDLGNWVTLGRGVLLLGWPGLLALVSVIPMWRHRQRAFWLGMLAAGVLPVVTFFNLYVVHSYYFAAVAPAFAGLAGLTVGWLWERRGNVFRAGVAAILVAALAGSLLTTRDYWDNAYLNIDPEATVPGLVELRASTGPSDLIVVEGYDWDPTLLYYARRRGQMVAVPKFVSAAFVEALPDAGYRFLVTTGLSDEGQRMLRRLPWTGVHGHHLYEMGSGVEEVADAPAIATDIPEPLARGSLLSDGPVSVPCGSGGLELPASDDGLVLGLSRPPPSGLITIGDRLAPIPARRWIALAAAVSRTGATLRCSGSEVVVLDGIWQSGLSAG